MNNLSTRRGLALSGQGNCKVASKEENKSEFPKPRFAGIEVVQHDLGLLHLKLTALFQRNDALHLIRIPQGNQTRPGEERIGFGVSADAAGTGDLLAFGKSTRILLGLLELLGFHLVVLVLLCEFEAGQTVGIVSFRIRDDLLRIFSCSSKLLFRV
jgi:hypothetical protein